MNIIWWTTNEEAVKANTIDRRLPEYIKHSLQRRLLNHRRGRVDFGLVIVDKAHFGSPKLPDLRNQRTLDGKLVGILVAEEDGRLMMPHYPGRWTDETFFTEIRCASHVDVQDDDLRWALGRLRRLKMSPDEEARYQRLCGDLSRISPH